MDSNTQQNAPSGIPYLAYLSGLPLGQGGMSGAQDPSLAGAGQAGAQGGAGNQGGMSLQDLQALLALQQGSGDTSAGSNLPIAQLGGFGNIAGGGSFGGGQNFGAGGQLGQGPTGQAGVNPGVAGATGGGLDAMAIIRQALGLGSQAAKLLPGQQSYQTIGDTGGVSLSDQLRSGQAGTASPMSGVAGYGGAPSGGDVNAPGVPQGLQDPNALGGLPPQGTSLDFLNQAQGGVGGIPQGTAQQELIQQMLAQGASPDQIVNAIGAQGFSAGEIPTGGSIGSGYQTAGDVGGANLGGAVSGGLSGLQGLLSAFQSLSGQGTDLSKILGTIQGLGGAASGGAGVSDALGLTSGLGGAIGGFGASAGALATLAQLLGTNPKAAEASMGPSLGLESIAGPIAGGSAAAAAGSAEAGSTLAALAPILSAAATPLAFTGPVLGVVLAIMDALGKPGNQAINRFTGVQGPQTTSAIENAANLTPQGTNFSQLPTDVLERLIPAEGNALERYYNQNLPEDRYLTGLQAEGSPELGQVQKAISGTQGGLLSAIAQLQQRGIGNDVIGNLMFPQLNNIAQMNNSAWAGVPGYQSPAALMQQQGFGSNAQLAGAYGGPTWLALQQILGPGAASTFGQYGINAPGLTLPQAPTGDLAAQNAASQYDPNLPATPEQIAAQYGALPAWLGSPQ